MELPAFAELLRRHRLDAGLSQEALAERSGLSLQAVSLLERGQRRDPRRQTVRALAAALDLSPAQVVALEGSVRRHRRTRPAALPRPPGLPPVDSAIVGRETDLAILPFLLRQPDVQLLTLVGPAGVGKTRLALEAAMLLAPVLAGDVTWVDLAPIRDAGLVVPTIAARVGLRQDAEPLLDRIAAHLQGRDMLLVLDNLEQVLSAAGLLQELLDACPALRILATSRIALGLHCERQYAVSPLALPPLGETNPAAVGEHAAVALFLACARSVVPGLALTAATAPIVAEVCRRLDGLPLAIELAAALARLVPPQAMLARLRAVVHGSSGAEARPDGATLDLLAGGRWDRPDRQQTMRQAIDWSYELLSPFEQTAFRGLGVFVDGWNAAAAATALGVPPDAMAATLDALLAKHLVRLIGSVAGTTRFGMLETIREYAAERLASLQPEAFAVRDRHLDWCLALAEEAEAQLTGPEQGAWLERLERDHGNLRAALTWARARGDGARGLQLAGALWRFWVTRGYFEEGRGWLEAALAQESVTPVPPAVRARACNGAANLAYEQSDFARATLLHESALALRRMLGDRHGVANSLNNLANVVAVQGDYRRAVSLHEEALALRRALGGKPGIAISLNNLGSLAYALNDLDRAATLHEEALALRRALGDSLGIATSLSNLGAVAAAQSDSLRAVALLEEGMALRRALGDRTGVAESLNTLGSVLANLGSYDRAAALFVEAIRLAGVIGAMSMTGQALEGLSWVAAAGGSLRRAARLAGAAEEFRLAIGEPAMPYQLVGHEQAVRVLRAGLDAETLASAWAEGRAYSPDDAVALALDAAPDSSPQSIGA